MTREKAKAIIESHGIGYTIEEWDEAMSVVFDGTSSLPSNSDKAAEK